MNGAHINASSGASTRTSIIAAKVRLVCATNIYSCVWLSYTAMCGPVSQRLLCLAYGKSRHGEYLLPIRVTKSSNEITYRYDINHGCTFCLGGLKVMHREIHCPKAS